eukprot:scaffold33939_cov112-Isochrysis_galbana.AAC.2
MPKCARLVDPISGLMCARSILGVSRKQARDDGERHRHRVLVPVRPAVGLHQQPIRVLARHAVLVLELLGVGRVARSVDLERVDADAPIRRAPRPRPLPQRLSACMLLHAARRLTLGQGRHRRILSRRRGSLLPK